MRFRAQSVFVWPLFLIAAGAAFVPVSSASTPTPSEQAERIRTAAFEQPLDDTRFNAYYQSLHPDAAGFVVVEGDLLLSREDLRRYVREHAPDAPKPARSAPELLVDTIGGQDNYYRDPAARHLTYTIDATGLTAAQVDTARKSIKAAAEDWVSACAECGVSFMEVGTNDNAFFVVRRNGDGRYLAASFFPNYPQARRYLNLDPTWFTTTITRPGIIRHELGHVLGYRHEHIRGIPGCFVEGGTWRPLTPYDPKSVMHYFCGGGGDLDLSLQESDKTGHRALYGPPPVQAAFEAPPSDAEKAVQSARDRAFANPNDVAAVEAFKKTLPALRSRPGFYIVEGDMMLSDAEIGPYLRQNASGEGKVTVPSGELIVNRIGKPPYHDDVYAPDHRTLTYRVDAASISPQHIERVRENMRQAALAWMNACPKCGIKFVHAAQYDADPDPPRGAVNFTVREEDQGGAFIAMSFFPHDPASRRVLIIDPSYYSTTFDQAGVLRHELGHVLGYRHEHIRDVPGCYREDNKWRPLTRYDSKSVMHYFCGNAGTMKLELSPMDKAGHRALYSRVTKIAEDEPPLQQLVIRFEGGDAAKNIGTVIRLLQKQSLLTYRDHVIGPDETFDRILLDELHIPGVDDSLRALTLSRNRKLDPKMLREGDVAEIPDLVFEDEGIKHIRFDTSKQPEKARYEQIQKAWDPLIVKSAEKDPSGELATVPVRTYQLKIPIGTKIESDRAQKVVDQIHTTSPLDHTYAKLVSSGPATAAYALAFVDPTTQFTDTTGNEIIDKDQEGDLGLMIGKKNRPVAPAAGCDDICPEVVLLDSVFHHPDIEPSLRAGALGSCAAAPVNGNRQTYHHVSWNPAYHGTHLAGIIGARANGFGIVGIDPEASITAVEWEPFNNPIKYDDFADKLDAMFGGAENLHIFAFASSWTYGRSLLRAPDDRFDSSALARFIRDGQQLWVVAAGQPSDGAQVLTTQSPIGPMNLGDLPNVVVVTACERCNRPDMTILTEVNTSPTLVHVAAPGFDIPSTAVEAAYTAQGGSSQASAFAAGLASAMARAWPKAYVRAPRLKLRLMQTSRPIAGPLAAGVIDEGVAMLNPNNHWLRMSGDSDHRELSTFKWTVNNVQMKEISTNMQRFEPAANIVRMYRMPDQSNGRSMWMVYEKVHDRVLQHDIDVIRRVGPVVIAGENVPIFTATYRMDDALCAPNAPPCLQPVNSLKDLEDLLLKDRVRQ